MRYLFKSHNLIGDALYIGPALRTWLKKTGANSLQDEIIIQTLPDHIAPLYQGMVRDLVNITTVFERPPEVFNFVHEFDVSKAFALSDEKHQHLAQSYAQLLGVDLNPKPNANCTPELKPIFIPDEGFRSAGSEETILISMFSASCESRDKDHPGMPPNKMLPFDKWLPMLQLIKREYPNTPVYFVGAPTDRVPDELIEYGTEMFGIPLNRLAIIMQTAKLVVTIDNGMSHLAASQEAPTFLMYPQCLAPYYILPVGNPNLVWIQMNPVTVNPRQLTHGLQFAINRFKTQEQDQKAGLIK